MIYLDVDTAVTVWVNTIPLTDDTDFKARETGITYDQAGMDLVWNFTTSAGVITQTAVTPTTSGVYDWTHVGDAMYKIEIPASGGGSINNDTAGYGYFSGICTGVLAWRGPTIGFRAALLNNALTDSGVNNLATKLDRNADLIESQRGSHTWRGGSYYVDVTGNDSTGDGSRALPYLTIQAAHDDLAVSGNHDVIFLGPGTFSTAATITLSKNYLSIRGKGRNSIITRTGSGDTIAITGDGIQISKAQIGTDNTGSGHGVKATGVDFVKIDYCWFLATQGDGVHLLRSTNCQIHDNDFDGTGVGGSGQGIHIVGTGGSSNGNVIYDNEFHGTGGTAILIEQGVTNDTLIFGNDIHDAGGWGINIGGSSNRAVVYNNVMGNNSSGDIADSGSNSIIKYALVVESDGAGHADVKELGGSAIRQDGGYIKISVGTGTGQLTVSSGVVAASGNWNTVTPDAAGTASSLHSTTDGKVDSVITTVNHTDYGNAKLVRSTTPANKLDITVNGNAGIDWGNVDNENTNVALINTAIASVGGAVGSVAGHTPQTGDSFARIGAAGAGLTNINLPNQTMDITGDITGNLSGSVGSVVSGGDATEAKQDTMISAIGTPVALDGGAATVGGMLTKMADDNAGADFDAGTDSLQEMRDQLDTIQGGTGSGARSVTITVDNGSGVKLENATVRLAEGGNTYVGDTNVSGVRAFSLDDFTYVVTIAKAGHSFAPTTLVVDGTITITYSMSVDSIDAPPNASTTTGVMKTYDEEGVVEASVAVSVQITEGPGTDGIGYDSAKWTETSNGSGVVQFAGIIKGARYKIWRGDQKAAAKTFTAPTEGDSFDLAEVIGRG